VAGPYFITLTDQPELEDVRFIEDGLATYNWQYAPPYNTQKLAVLLRAEDGTLLGGVLGLTWWGWLRIDIVWLNEAMRGQDWGTRLMQTAEAEAIRRGCRHVFLDTMSFQALPFYLRLGYEVFGQLNDLPEGHQMYFLRKALLSAESDECPRLGFT
jgi:GNAT superfamily N-acetyltransferase